MFNWNLGCHAIVCWLRYLKMLKFLFALLEIELSCTIVDIFDRGFIVISKFYVDFLQCQSLGLERMLNFGACSEAL